MKLKLAQDCWQVSFKEIFAAVSQQWGLLLIKGVSVASETWQLPFGPHLLHKSSIQAEKIPWHFAFLKLRIEDSFLWNRNSRVANSSKVVVNYNTSPQLGLQHDATCCRSGWMDGNTLDGLDSNPGHNKMATASRWSYYKATLPGRWVSQKTMQDRRVAHCNKAERKVASLSPAAVKVFLAIFPSITMMLIDFSAYYVLGE